MKRRFFIAMSVVSAFVMGLLMVSCSSESNTLSPNEDAVFAESIQQVEETSSEEWEAFNAAIEELNAQYFPQNSTACYAFLSDSMKNEDDTNELKKQIVYADIDGAIEGAGIGSDVGGVTGAIIGAILVGAYESYKEYDLSRNEAIITTNALKMINNINGTSIGIEVGIRHNVLIDKLIKDKITFNNISDRQAMNLLINQYESLYSTINAGLKSALLGDTSVRVPDINSNVRQANQNFRLSVANLSTSNLRNYTTEYLSIVDRTISNDTDKMYMSTYASQMYYSTALWVVL